MYLYTNLSTYVDKLCYFVRKTVVKELWTNVLNSLEGNINKQSFNMWLKDTEPIDLNGDVITIKVIDDVTQKHINDQYLGLLTSKVYEVTQKNYKIKFITNNDVNKTVTDDVDIIKTFSKNKPLEEEKTSLNPKNTFENFIIGPNNQLAHAAARSISQNPATQYNPFFIYGPSGVGKTHLMQAIGQFIIKEQPFLKVLYVRCIDFIDDFISSIRTNTTSSFKIKYRDVDILLIDDIQFIEKKEETQNEFFHTFNTLYENKKQIIISSDRSPKELKTLEDRLRTRFEWGMITDIQPPNLETREAILKNKAEKENINLSDEVIYYIAKRIKSSIRLLEGALTRLSIVESEFGEEITINHAKMHLKDFFDKNEDTKINISEIMQKISDKYDVTVEELKSKSRQNRIIKPRFMAMFLTRQLTGMTTIEIGKKFGDRDHSTVVNAINNIEDQLKKDTDFKDQLEEITYELKN